jgi:hypothetical protein
MTLDGYRTLDLGVLKVGIMAGLFWFRIFNKGLHIKDVRRHPLTFSQRTTWPPDLTIGDWQIRKLV